MKKIFLLGIFIVVPLMGGCHPSASTNTSTSILTIGGHTGPFIPYEVEFNANASNPMKTLFANGNCTKGSVNSRKGCMQFSKGSWGVIIFGFVHEPKNKTCNHAGVNWVITKVGLSDTGDIASSKGSNFDSQVPVWVKDSFLGVELTTGVIYEKDWDKAYTSVGVINLNNHMGDEDIWYHVTAAKCATGHATNESDPRVENMGR